MSARVLVTFASKHGSTAEIAKAIASVLGEAGLQVDLRASKDVGSVSHYDAVVLGTALYYGRWFSQGADFIERFERDLRERPTWVFSSGPTGGTPKGDAQVALATSSPDAIPPLPAVASYLKDIGARGHATFGGRIGEDMTGLFERWMPRGDWRSFDAVRAWARSIAGALAEGSTSRDASATREPVTAT